MGPPVAGSFGAHAADCFSTLLTFVPWKAEPGELVSRSLV